MMRNLVIAASLCMLPALSPAAVLDFEGFNAGTFLTTEYQAANSIVFTENAQIYFLGPNHATSGQYGLFNGGAPISAEFVLPGNIAAATNSVAIKGDLIPISGNVTLQAYDINGNLIGTDVKPDSPAPSTLSISLPGIHRIVFFAASNTVAFDDLSFNAPTAIDGQTVPEPGSMALLFSGGVLLAAARRRQRR